MLQPHISDPTGLVRCRIDGCDWSVFPDEDDSSGRCTEHGGDPAAALLTDAFGNTRWTYRRPETE